MLLLPLLLLLLILCAFTYLWIKEKNVITVATIALHGQLYFSNNFVTWSVVKDTTMQKLSNTYCCAGFRCSIFVIVKSTLVDPSITRPEAMNDNFTFNQVCPVMHCRRKNWTSILEPFDVRKWQATT